MINSLIPIESSAKRNNNKNKIEKNAAKEIEEAKQKQLRIFNFFFLFFL